MIKFQRISSGGGGGGLAAKLCLTFATARTPLSMGFPRHKYWSGLSFPSPKIFPIQESNPGSLALQADSLSTKPPGKPLKYPNFFFFKEISDSPSK